MAAPKAPQDIGPEEDEALDQAFQDLLTQFPSGAAGDFVLFFAASPTGRIAIWRLGPGDILDCITHAMKKKLRTANLTSTQATEAQNPANELHAAMHPTRAITVTMAAIEEMLSKNMGTNNLRDTLDKIGTEWNLNPFYNYDADLRAPRLVEQFKALSEESHNLEATMYDPAESLFAAIVEKRGCKYHQTPGLTKSLGQLLPDGEIRATGFDHCSIDVEIKTKWSPIQAPKKDLPWYQLPGAGARSNTPVAGIWQILKRACHSFTANPHQESYVAILTDLSHFVFISVGHDGPVLLSRIFTFGEKLIRIIWNLCDFVFKAAGFRQILENMEYPPPSPLIDLKAYITDDSGRLLLLTSLRPLGAGSHGSMTLSCTQFGSDAANRLLCLKLAPISSDEACMQLELEIIHLDILKECPCVPKVVTKGKVEFCFRTFQGLLTDVVGTPLPLLPKPQLQVLLPTLWPAMKEAVEMVHSKKVVHADLKPNHFIVNEYGLWIIDFGSAFTQLSRILRLIGGLYTTTMFSSARILYSTDTWPTFEDDLQSAAYSFAALLSPSCELPVDHQKDASIILSSIPPHHHELVLSALKDANIEVGSPITLSPPISKKRKHTKLPIEGHLRMWAMYQSNKGCERRKTL